MPPRTLKKPSFDTWLLRADTLSQRLNTIYRVYEDNGQHDKASRVAIKLSHIHSIMAGQFERHLSEQPYAVLQRLSAGAQGLEDAQIAILAAVFLTTLKEFPSISKDMQKLLKSPWQGECNGRLASDLFKGPRGSHNEGIGSGQAIDGMLPMLLEDLLQQEEKGETRATRHSVLTPQERQRWAETARRWAEQNSVHLRRAGQVE